MASAGRLECSFEVLLLALQVGGILVGLCCLGMGGLLSRLGPLCPDFTSSQSLLRVLKLLYGCLELVLSVSKGCLGAPSLSFVYGRRSCLLSLCAYPYSCLLSLCAYP